MLFTGRVMTTALWTVTETSTKLWMFCNTRKVVIYM
jgi:hypothetical protein